jgi:hypothetical protein
MASINQAALGLAGEVIHHERLDTFGPDSLFESAVSPPFQGVQVSDVASVWIRPDASDEEDALIVGESVTIIIMIIVWAELACAVQVAPC